MKATTYDNDYYAWTLEQARKLRAGEPVDVEHIAEELESLGSISQEQLTNRLAVLLCHMLKWEFQPERRSRSWEGTMTEQRRRIERILRKMPSLQNKWDECVIDAYPTAVTFASVETGIVEEDFPNECPYSTQQIRQGK